MRPFLAFLTVVGLSAGLAKEEPNPYPEFQKDREALRSTMLLTKPPLQASSGEAIAAARRLFGKVAFEGLKRQQVLEMLGDPKTISDYGVEAPAAPDGPLTYRFDSGFGGWEFVIRFENGVVQRVDARGLD
jgi:hypothetical protein